MPPQKFECQILLADTDVRVVNIERSEARLTGRAGRIGQHIEQRTTKRCLSVAHIVHFVRLIGRDFIGLRLKWPLPASGCAPPAPSPSRACSLTVLKKLLGKLPVMRFIFTSAPQPRGGGQKKRRKIKTFNAFFITHCHCPPLATPPLPLACRQRVLCAATLFVQATCLNKSYSSSSCSFLFLPLLLFQFLLQVSPA